jgi:lysozyme
MRLSDKGAALIQKYEALELKAYPDPASPLGLACTKAGLRMANYAKVKGYKLLEGKPWTIGWGHTGPEVTAAMVVTEEEAKALFAQDVARFEGGVETLVRGLRVTQGQFDALVSLAYNIGLRNLQASTLLKFFKNGQIAYAAQQFEVWNKARQGGVLKELPGLTRRRRDEQALFLS